MSYYELADELGVTPAQIERKLRIACEQTGDFEYFLRTSLVRQMRHYVPNGIKTHGEWKLIRALSSWIGMVGSPTEIELRCQRVADRIQQDTQVPANWIPSSADDEKLAEYFMD
jgi:hypothetical protein